MQFLHDSLVWHIPDLSAASVCACAPSIHSLHRGFFAKERTPPLPDSIGRRVAQNSLLPRGLKPDSLRLPARRENTSRGDTHGREDVDADMFPAEEHPERRAVFPPHDRRVLFALLHLPEVLPFVISEP